MLIPGNVALFEGISAEEVTTLLSCLSFREATFVRGESIIREGDPVGSFGIILSGFVQIVRNDYSGQRMILSGFGTGSVFAESFACAEIARSPVSVVAAEDCSILFLPYRKMLGTCRSACLFHQRLIENLMRLIARKNLMLSSRMEIAGKRTIREKVLAYLGQERARAGSPSFDVPYSRSELADYLCVDRSALSRELGRMRDEGLVEYSRGRFTIL